VQFAAMCLNGYLQQLPDHPNSKINTRALAWITASDEKEAE
jgi:hypothetical protein